MFVCESRPLLSEWCLGHLPVCSLQESVVIQIWVVGGENEGWNLTEYICYDLNKPCLLRAGFRTDITKKASYPAYRNIAKIKERLYAVNENNLPPKYASCTVCIYFDWRIWAFRAWRIFFFRLFPEETRI